MADWFLQNEYLGSHPRAPYRIHGEAAPRPSVAYYCRVCGEVWARIVDEGGWDFIPRRCPKHGPAFLLSAIDDSFNEAPLNVLVREFLIAMQHPSYRTTLICDGGAI